MSYSQDQLQALKSALARGVLEAVLPDGSRVRYRSVDEMERIIRKIEDELGMHAQQTNITYPTHTRGFD